tara:strand:- start:13 stop:837 length:825 start_codon:yes stop_codon:yes gene_type:complete
MFENLLAGGLAGALSRTCVAPLELYKIQSQANYIPDASWRQVIKKEGIRYLWKGNFTNCVRIAPQIAVNFTTFEYVKSNLEIENKDIKNLMAGATAGSVSMTAIYPLETIRTRLSLQTNKSHYNGIWNCFRTMKLREMYGGLRTSLIGFTPYMAINFALYHRLKEGLNKKAKSHTSLNETSINLLSGGLSGLGAVTITYPTDLIRRQLQLQGFDPTVPKYDGIYDCTKKIIKSQGIRGLYRGLLPCYITNFPKFAIQFWAFEYFQKHIKNLTQV